MCQGKLKCLCGIVQVEELIVWNYFAFQGLSSSVGLQREKSLKTVKDFCHRIAEFRQQRIAEFKAIREDAKGGDDGYRQGVIPVVELKMIVRVHGYHEGKRQAPEYQFGDDAAGIIKIAGDVGQPADRTNDHTDGKG